MENESYKKLYYHAFNRLTDLAKEIERTQNELEEMYLEAGEHLDDSIDQQKSRSARRGAPVRLL